jgi:hypothetical protein
MKWNNRLKAVLTQTAKSGFSEESLETPLTITDKTPLNLVSSAFVSDEFRHSPGNVTNSTKAKKQLNLVSSAFVSAYSRHSSKNKEGLAELKTDYFHAVLNQFIADGITFDVSADDFQVIDNNQKLKVSDKEFLELNNAAILCTLQQSLLMKHLFNHSPEQFEDFAFEIQEREAIFSEVSTKPPLTKADKTPLEIRQREPFFSEVPTKTALTTTDKTPFEIYFEAVKDVTRKWFAELLEKKT